MPLARISDRPHPAFPEHHAPDDSLGPRGRRTARFAAVVSALSGGTHLLTAVAHPGTVRLLMFALTPVCLVCAVHLWRGGAGLATWCFALAMAGAMVLVHLLLMAGHAHHPAPTQLSWLTDPGVLLGVPFAALLAVGGAGYRTYQAIRLS